MAVSARLKNASLQTHDQTRLRRSAKALNSGYGPANSANSSGAERGNSSSETAEAQSQTAADHLAPYSIRA